MIGARISPYYSQRLVFLHTSLVYHVTHDDRIRIALAKVPVATKQFILLQGRATLYWSNKIQFFSK